MALASAASCSSDLLAAIGLIGAEDSAIVGPVGIRSPLMLYAENKRFLVASASFAIHPVNTGLQGDQNASV